MDTSLEALSIPFNLRSEKLCSGIRIVRFITE
jgi:hypothetical protein